MKKSIEKCFCALVGLVSCVVLTVVANGILLQVNNLNPTYRIGDTVEITKGFYRGCVGEVGRYDRESGVYRLDAYCFGTTGTKAIKDVHTTQDRMTPASYSAYKFYEEKYYGQ